MPVKEHPLRARPAPARPPVHCKRQRVRASPHPRRGSIGRGAHCFSMLVRSLQITGSKPSGYAGQEASLSSALQHTTRPTGQTSQKKHLATQPVAFRMPRSNTAGNPLSGMACTISSLPRSSRISGHRVTFRSTAEETRTHHRYTGKDRRRYYLQQLKSLGSSLTFRRKRRKTAHTSLLALQMRSVHPLISP